MQPHRESPGMQARRKSAVNAVTQAAFFAHLLGQARDETAAAQNVIAHQQGKKVGVSALVAGLAYQYMGLGRVKGQVHVLHDGQRGHFGHGRQAWAA